ncbi:MAG: hypothetical protein PHE44_12290 [Proteiniphilum sp.]|nr:hypothetical protein [Proteiniphilum sp.]
MIPKAQTPEQLKVMNLRYHIDMRGTKWIKLNRSLADHYIIDDLIKLSKEMGIEYKIITGNKFPNILIDPVVYDEYMSDVLEGND